MITGGTSILKNHQWHIEQAFYTLMFCKEKLPQQLQAAAQLSPINW